MTLIQDICNLETEFGDVWISKQLGSQIVATLKASQAIREEVQAMSDEGYYLTAPLEQALEIWDDTTKEIV